MNELALFSGAGGGILASSLLGFRTIGAVEIAPYPREVLLQRQRDGILPEFPIWDDIRDFNAAPWHGHVDVVSGGFPCQDISAAGKGAGLSGERSGLWYEMWRVVREVRPTFTFVENSPMLATRGLDRVLGEMAESGYDAAWMVLGAAHVGAPHLRQRLWILAVDTQRLHLFSHPDNEWARWRQQQPESFATTSPSDSEEPRCQRDGMYKQPQSEIPGVGDAGSSGGTWSPWQTESGICRVADGVANRVDRIKSLGNGQVPLVAATAFIRLYDQLQQYIQLQLSPAQ